jgi:hypothetical protein
MNFFYTFESFEAKLISWFILKNKDKIFFYDFNHFSGGSARELTNEGGNRGKFYSIFEFIIHAEHELFLIFQLLRKLDIFMRKES